MTDSARVFCFDFDGTLAHMASWPAVGEPRWDIVHAMSDIRASGHRALIYTARTGPALDAVKEWFANHGIHHDGIIEGSKPVADVYVDDRAMTPDALLLIWPVMRQVIAAEQARAEQARADQRGAA